MATLRASASAAALAWSMTMLVAPRTMAQLSPGPLARAHAELEGASHCFECHESRDGSSIDQQCQACHREIAVRVERGSGLHGREGRGDCARCHPDHAGSDFELIQWTEGGPADFDHDRTGWPLAGRHAATACRDCHKPEFQVEPFETGNRPADPRRTWLGLGTRCTACHADPHNGALDATCTTCHTERVWRPAPRFDHAASVYPLTGKHAKVACEGCHLVPGKVFSGTKDGRSGARYKPVPYAECSSCHVDPHAGRLGPGCAVCHTTESFRQVAPEEFDHERTRYPLRGKHRVLDCSRCHDVKTAWGARPSFARCAACHADAHAGRATLAGHPADCAGCHGLDGFSPATFSVQDHARSAYPLEGAHRKVACADCHPKKAGRAAAAELGIAGVLLRPPYRACRDCHTDDHEAQLDAREGGGACESCHTVASFSPSTFSVERHDRTALPLRGRHADTTCAACHAASRRDLGPLPSTATLGRARWAFVPLASGCETCHFDPHRGRFSPTGERPVRERCLACHGLDAFRPSSMQAAEHDTSRFPLEGAHRATPCFECHEELRQPAPAIHLLRVAGAARTLGFAAIHGRCQDCHRSPHGAQFEARRGGDACEVCHDVAAFRPASRFEHDRDSTFVLDRAHRDVPCARCHPARLDADGVSRVVYRPLAAECKACHAPGSKVAGGAM